MDNAWGTLTLSFTDADHGRVEFSSTLGYGAGSMNFTRLTKVVAPNASDPSSAAKWVAAASLGVVRAGHTATLLLDGRVLVAGGSGDPTAELYDPVTDTWRGAANMSASVYFGSAATLLRNGKVLIVDGIRFELYDPVSDTWTDMPDTDGANTATLLADGRVLVTTAAGDGWGDFEYAYGKLYDPETGKWTFTARTSYPFTTPTLLHNGKVLVVGLSSSSQIRPVMDTWDLVGGPEFAYGAYAALTLADGSVMVVGEESVWVFDPAASAWARIADLNIPRRSASATLLPDGNVLVVGGRNCSADACTSVATTELYECPHTAVALCRRSYTGASWSRSDAIARWSEYHRGRRADGAGRSREIPLASAELCPGATHDRRWLHRQLVRPCAKRPRTFRRGPAKQPFSRRMVCVQSRRNAAGVVPRRGHVQRQHGNDKYVIQPSGGRWIPNFDPRQV